MVLARRDSCLARKETGAFKFHRTCNTGVHVPCLFLAWSRARHGQCLVSVISINWLWAHPGSLTGTVRLSLGTQHACYCWRRREREMAGLWFLLRRNGNFRCTNRRQCWKVSSDKRWEMFLLIFTRIRTCSTYYLKASAIVVNSLFVMQVLQFKCFDVLYY